MNWMIPLLACYGLCFGLMNEKLSPVSKFLTAIPLLRDAEGRTFFTRMLACAYCTGFHTGWIVWGIWKLSSCSLTDGLVWGIQDLTFEENDLPPLVLFSFASSAFCYSLDVLLARLER